MASKLQIKLLVCLFGLQMVAPDHVLASDRADRELQFAQRQVVAVLEEYRQLGYEILYSRGVVRRQLKFLREPELGDPLARLTAALAELGLEVRQDGQQKLRIVQRAVDASTNAISGQVLDADTGKPLAGVLVEIEGLQLLTDDEGRFVLHRPDIRTVAFERDGYVPQTAELDRANGLSMEIKLAPAYSLEEMVVVSSRYAVADVKTRAHRVDQKLLNTLPSLGEDPIRITSYLPGMAGVGVSAKPYIRGGDQDELLVLFNNVELLEPFHLRDFQSIFSTFNPSTINQIDIYTGGFPIRYGDRMSGVMDIEPGTTRDDSRGEIGLSLLNVSGLLSGSIDDGRGDWVVSARRGNLDLVTKEVNSTVGDPSYSDGFSQLRYELSANTEMDVGALFYNDDIELSDFDEDGEMATSKYRNTYAWAQIRHAFDNRSEGWVLGYLGTIDHNREGILIDEDLDNGLATVDDDRAIELFTVNGSYSRRENENLSWQIGARLSYQQAEYRYRGLLERGVLAEFLGTELNEIRNYDLDPSGFSGGVYGSVRVRPRDALTIEAGLRWDFQAYDLGSRDDQLSPRVSMLWQVSDETHVRVSYGRFFQPEGIHELQVGDGIANFQRPQYADHAIVGLHHQLSESWGLRAEVYDKKIRDPKRRFENLFNNLVLLPELASDRVELRPSQARARGGELSLRYDGQHGNQAWLSVSYGKAEDKIAGEWQRRTWDQGTSLTSGYTYQSDRWRVALAIAWHDGWRTTPLPRQISEGVMPDVVRNSGRLKDYFTLDFEVSRRWSWPGHELELFLEVTNGLSRRNVGGIEYDVEEDEDLGLFSLEPQAETLMPLVPSLGIRWQF